MIKLYVSKDRFFLSDLCVFFIFLSRCLGYALQCQIKMVKENILVLFPTKEKAFSLIMKCNVSLLEAVYSLIKFPFIPSLLKGF